MAYIDDYDQLPDNNKAIYRYSPFAALSPGAQILYITAVHQKHVSANEALCWGPAVWAEVGFTREDLDEALRELDECGFFELDHSQFRGKRLVNLLSREFTRPEEMDQEMNNENGENL